MTTLKLLKPQLKKALPSDFFDSEDVTVDMEPFLEPFSRNGKQLDLTPTLNIFKAGMVKFATSRTASDAWLATRLHATLRLTKREAGDQKLWEFLAVGPLRQYVFWRWSTGQESTKKFQSRFFGNTREQALARLWWGAELTRNGPSYEPTNTFFRNTDVPNSWLSALALRNRPAAVATTQFIYEHKVEGVSLGDMQRMLSIGFNAALSTSVLDSVASSPPGDPGAIEEWLSEEGRIDETKYLKAEPTGPNETPVPEQKVMAVLHLLDRVATITNFKVRKRTTQKLVRKVAES